jgi:hypothetical protein
MCGIAGIINTRPRKFDYSTFCTLGIANDIRGGDSCGIFIDKQVDYGVKDNKYFSDFFLENDIINTTDVTQIALLHCRKASIGNISIETAQPVVITNGNNVIDFVLMHNGTIHNYKELAKEYIPDMDITNMTDSQVLAHIIYHTGYEVLSKYNGTAALAIVDYRHKEPKTLLFHGASKKNTYSKEAEEERPLCYCINKYTQELIFSSIGIYLCALRPECTAYHVPYNKLCVFTGKALKVIDEIDRSSCIQTTTYNSRSMYTMYECTPFCYNAYISVDVENDLYTYNKELLHGEYTLTKFGKVIENNEKYDYSDTYYFFNGVALKDKKSFTFLESMLKKSNLPIYKFALKFNQVIRFLSINQLLPGRSVWYQVHQGKSCFQAYTGIYRPLGSLNIYEFKNGTKVHSAYAKSYLTYDEYKTIYQYDNIDFKQLEKLCMSLMK